MANVLRFIVTYLYAVCSIIGYKGRSHAAPILVDSLSKMEYRGYDSVGIATITSGKILVRKGVGKVVDVNKSLELREMLGETGIGHTRWATHGGVTDNNAHPHCACTNEIAVVHNGIIENYNELKQELIALGHRFASQTDSEVIAHMLEAHYYSNQRDIKKAMINTCERLKGAYAFVAIFKEGAISGARYDEPLILGVLGNEYFISSDILGFLKYTDKAIFLDNKDIVVIENEKLDLFSFDGNCVKRPITQVAWELAAAEKGAYAHYTLKEIHEQSRTIADALMNNELRMHMFCDILANTKNVYITGSGTSYHSALILKLMLGRYAKIRSETIMSSEFEYTLGPLDDNSAVIAISQSGETADVLHSVKAVKQTGAKVLSVVNVPTSSLARISDCFLSLNCGPEIGVAATKSFTGQLSVLYSIVDTLCNGCIGISLNKSELVTSVHQVLSAENDIARIVNMIHDINDIYILGRSLHYPIALEGALKIKEIAYIHAEGIAAGELKHGPLALIDKNTVMIVINPHDTTFGDTLSNAYEIKARGATVIGISDVNSQVYDHFINIPKVNDVLYPMIEIIPLQILSYYLALKKNVDPDYPRNLAKSVTVR